MEQAVVVEHEHGVGAASQGLQPLEGTSHALTALHVERCGDNPDDQGTGRLGFLCHDRADAGAGTAAKTGGDEDEVGTGDDALDHLSTGLRTASTGGRVAACTESTGDVAANEEFLKRSGVVEVLLVGVDGDGHGAFNAEVRDAVEGVVARATATDDENAGVGDAQRADFLVHERGRAALMASFFRP